MRILAITDIHGSESVKYAVREWLDMFKPEIVTISGDITNFGPPSWARKFLDAIPLPKFAVPGNCDPPNVIEEIKKSKAKCLHFSREKYKDFEFVGLGGSISTPFGTPFELEEEEIYNELKKVIVPRAIIVSHTPAKGHLDSIPSRGSGLGSVSLLRIVKEYQPILFISGHIHESVGVERDGKTVFVNPGPAKNNMCAIIDIPDAYSKNVDMKTEIKVDLISQ